MSNMNDYLAKGIRITTTVGWTGRLVNGSPEFDYSKPQRFDAAGAFATTEDAQQFIAQFPKYVKVRLTTLSGSDDVTGERWVLPYVSLCVSFTEDGVQGKANETGAKRVRKFLEVLPTTGVTFGAGMTFANSVSLDDFLALI
jgi:uncharacterized Fe-S cluster-containing radical SAM superfamily protein